MKTQNPSDAGLSLKILTLLSLASLTSPIQFMALMALVALVALTTPLQLSPRSRLMGGQLALTLSKTLIFHTSFTPMALARPTFSVIRCIFAGKTVFKTRFFDHRKGQFPLFHDHFNVLAAPKPGEGGSTLLS
ncbi:MAG TPA: hypothetical protein VMF08_01595 [Candidatus Sulfotelmatobacter sp.]|nr:hypothetical protein [Candidatus Sulfotelmatobacter sp.]